MRRILPLLLLAAAASAQELTLEAITAEPGPAGPALEQIQWSPDGKTLSYVLGRPDDSDRRDLWAVDPVTGEKRVLISAEALDDLAPTVEEATADERERERLRRYSVAAYRWSPDSKALLFAGAGRLRLFDPADGSSRRLAPGSVGVKDPKFSPDGRWVSFVRDHDLWLAPSDSGSERPLTRGGSADLLRGDLDWIYPEEFGLRTGYHWSPDSRRVAFLEIDQSNVPTYPITSWTSIDPRVDFQRYPKAGDPNPRVRVGVVEVERRKPKPAWFEFQAEYLPRLAWIDSDRLAVQTLDRSQTEWRLVEVDVDYGARAVLGAETAPHWFNVSDDLSFTADGGLLRTSEVSGFRHIVRRSADGVERALTAGEWEVKEIAAVADEWIYYVSNEANPLGADLYRVRLDGGDKQRLTEDRGTHAVRVAPDGGAWLDAFSSIDDPGATVVIHRDSGRRTELRRAADLSGYDLKRPELIEFEAAGGLIRMALYKPDGITAGQRLPVVLYVYGGPRAPVIRDASGDLRGRDLFHQYLVKKGYVAALVDDRASSRLGRRFEAALHRAYGPTALADHLRAAEKLKEFDFIDPERIGIWGWSGGGMATCVALTHSRAFRAGAAVAPVTDWRLYDSIYTERYMGLPGAEAEAYRRASCVEAADDLSGRLLLVHGTADDNVHVQNTIRLADALIRAGKEFDLKLYPDKTHGLAGEETRLHLYRAIFEHFELHLK